MLKKYNEKYYARYGDPRTAKWLLMDNQIYPFLLGAVYLTVTKLILPRLMKKRNPYKLRKLTFGYNLVMMILNAWVFYQLSNLTVFKPNFNFSCQAIDWSDSAEALKVAENGWIFLITTILEQFVTILIILRKKDPKLSAIHSFVRIQAPFVVWYGLKFAPGGYNSLYSLLFSLIFAILHFHHAAAALVRSFLHPYWKNITLLAFYVMQFTIFIYYSQLYFFPPKNCKLSIFILRLNMGSAILFFVFAKDFFRTKFKNKSNKVDSSKSDNLQKMEKIL